MSIRGANVYRDSGNESLDRGIRNDYRASRNRLRRFSHAASRTNHTGEGRSPSDPMWDALYNAYLSKPGPARQYDWVINPVGAPAAAAILLPMETLAALGGLACVLVAA